MFAVVDYDNIEEPERRKGLLYLSERVLTAFVASCGTTPPRVHFRLYGGWYEGQNLTRSAQSLAAAVQKAFPRFVNIAANTGCSKVFVNIELAYSLAAEPTRHLWHTYRRRGTFRNLKCNHPTSIGCSDVTCPILPLYDFVKTGRCPKPGCTSRIQDILYRSEQKLVDTMIAADIMYYAAIGEKQVCVVTSDDDLWPAIRMVLLTGTSVVQVHPVEVRAVPQSYSSGVGDNYIQANW